MHKIISVALIDSHYYNINFMYICILYVGSTSLPFWLYIVVAVLGTVLVTVTILFACFFIIRGCKKSRRSPKNVYKVNSQKGWLSKQYEWDRRIIMYISSFLRVWEQDYTFP